MTRITPQWQLALQLEMARAANGPVLVRAAEIERAGR